MARQHSVPRHKRLSRQSRLQAAKHWMAQYPGNNILRGYRKHFECALKELTLLGITFDAQHISQWRQSLHGQQEHRRRRHEAQLNEDEARIEEWSWSLQVMGMDSEAHEEPPPDIREDH